MAFVLSGGASLGGVQVGMLRALVEHGIAPDLVVGTSVGSLNGAVLAETGDVARAAERLEEVCGGLRRGDVFAGGLVSQSLRLPRSGQLFPNTGLRRLIDPAHTCASRFLSETDPPQIGRMAGAPHRHEDDAYRPPVLDVALDDLPPPVPVARHRRGATRIWSPAVTSAARSVGMR